jgi:hypothetical protein
VPVLESVVAGQVPLPGDEALGCACDLNLGY